MKNLKLLLIIILCLGALSIVCKLEAQELSDRRVFIQGREAMTLTPEGVGQVRDKIQQQQEEARKMLIEMRMDERRKEYEKLIGETDLNSKTPDKGGDGSGSGDTTPESGEDDGVPVIHITPPIGGPGGGDDGTPTIPVEELEPEISEPEPVPKSGGKQQALDF